MIGQIIVERYKVLEILGSGNMAKTYLTQDLKNSEELFRVVKHFIPSHSNHQWLEANRTLFTKEAKSLQALSINNQIPQFLDYFEDDGEFYLVQECVEGHSLDEELTLGERWTASQVIDFLEEMLSVLAFVHQQGIIHRDIKPSNIMRRFTDEKLMLIDFGAVKQIPARQPKIDGKTSVTVVVGTPGYMPTEQANGKPQPSSDIYALGMIAIQALTGLLPRQLRENEHGEWIWQEQAEVSEEFAAVLSKMVRHYHKQRFQSVSEALEAIESLRTNPSKNVKVDRTNAQNVFTIKQPVNSGADPVGNHSPDKQDSDQSQGHNRPPTPTVRAMPVTRVNTIVTSPAIAPRTKRAILSAVAIILTLAVPGVAYLVHAKTLSEQEKQVLNLKDLQESEQYSSCLQAAAALPNLNPQWTQTAQEIQAKCEVGKNQTVALEEIKGLQTQGELEICIEKAQGFPEPKTTALAGKAEQILSQCQMSRAQQLAQAGRYVDAIAIAEDITSPAENYGETQKLISQWSYRILDLAKEAYGKTGNLKTAEAYIAAIPEHTAAYQGAQVSLAGLSENYGENQTFLASARKAFDEKRWQDAILAASKITLASMQKEKAYIINESRKTLKAEKEPFLVKESVLTSSNVDSYGNPYHEYTFEGEAEKTVVLMMESDQFDTYMRLVGPDGRTVASSDDRGPDDLNSSITLPLPESGTYVVKATAYSRSGRGEYRLTARYLLEN